MDRKKGGRKVQDERGTGVRGLLKTIQPQWTPPQRKIAGGNPTYLLTTAPQNRLSHDVSACIIWEW
jgi:hypothetical protein